MKKDRSNIRRAVNEGALKAEVLNGIAYECVKRITHTSFSYVPFLNYPANQTVEQCTYIVPMYHSIMKNCAQTDYAGKQRK